MVKHLLLVGVVSLLIAFSKGTAAAQKGIAGSNPHDKSIVEIFMDYIDDQDIEILSKILPHIFGGIDIDNADVGDDSVWGDSSFGDLAELVGVLNDNGTVEDNSTTPVCTACRAAITTLKALVAAFEWDEARDLLVDLCYELTNRTDDSIQADVLCPGVIDLQGPHVYEVLKPIHRKSPEDVCRNLNACFPPHEEWREYAQSHVSKTKKVVKAKKHQKSLADRKNEALTIVQMADIHIEPHYMEGTETDCGLPVCCVEDYGTGTASLYGDYNCNIPQRTMELFFTAAAKFNPQFILYSGDSPPHTMWLETYESQLDVTEMLVESMARLLPDFRVYPGIGNHEMYPTNLYSMEFLPNYTAPMSVEFASLWEDLADFTEEDVETMAAGGYYSTEVAPGLRLISINTNYWYTFNWYNVLHEGGQEESDMMEFMTQALQMARQNDEKVILMGHHPPGQADAIIVYTRFLEDLLTEYSDLLVLHVCGHTHNDEFKVLSSPEEAPLAVVWAAPSVTGWGKDPSMRVYYIDSDTFEILDFEKHGFILADTIESGQAPNITLQYSAMEEYELPDMTPQSWRELVDRMETDDLLFQAYFENFVAGPMDGETCAGECRARHMCSNKHYQFDDYYMCTQETELY